MDSIGDIRREVEQSRDVNNAEESTPESAIVQTTSSGTLAPPMGKDFGEAVREAQQSIVGKAKEKIKDKKLIEKHSENLAKITDRALDVEAEQQRLLVEKVNADNKVVEQEIKNRLIQLKAEAKRLKREQKQLSVEQKADHKARNAAAKWELYRGKLEKMHYTYVPNAFVLAMLLFFDGVVGFFNGLGAVSTAIVKALKWALLVGLVLLILFAIPVTRTWIINLLGFGK